MEAQRSSSSSGYSPEISAELFLHGRRFAVAAIGPHMIGLHVSENLEPGQGTIRLSVDGNTTIYHVDLVDGVDPARKRQPCRILSSSEEVAA